MQRSESRNRSFARNRKASWKNLIQNIQNKERSRQEVIKILQQSPSFFTNASTSKRQIWIMDKNRLSKEQRCYKSNINQKIDLWNRVPNPVVNLQCSWAYYAYNHDHNGWNIIHYTVLLTLWFNVITLHLHHESNQWFMK